MAAVTSWKPRKGALRLHHARQKTDYACGDHVDLLVQNAEQAVIERAQPRQNLLYRSDAFRSKLIAANVTQLAIVLAPCRPLAKSC